MKYPKISIVTPSFNQAKYLDTTIRSVLDQGYPNLEYIIIDGGSTDGSVEIIQNYAPHLSYWVSEKDRGQSYAINKGFARSSGEIMGWLNSDDYYSPGSLWQVAEKLSEQKMTLLVGSAIQLDEENSGLKYVDKRKPSLRDMIYDNRTFPQPSVFWTRDLWQTAGPLDESLYFVMDYDLWLRMRNKAEQELMLDETLSYILLHPDQKWKRSLREGTFSKFTQERVAVSIRAAQARGEKPFGWLMRLWFYRIRLAFMMKNRSLLKGSEYHWEATRQVLNLAPRRSEN